MADRFGEKTNHWAQLARPSLPGVSSPLVDAGVELIDEYRGGTGVRLKKPAKKKV
jgi:hypothetical protein